MDDDKRDHGQRDRRQHDQLGRPCGAQHSAEQLCLPVARDDLSSFLTLEGQSNTAQLRGRFTSELSAAPVPAAPPLMPTALGGFAWLRRPRKA